MNKWIEKSIDLANSKGYLDNLFEVYPVEKGDLRFLSKDIKKEIIQNYKTGNKILLIKTLLKLKKFPIDDPYIASFRKNKELLKNNPKTIKRIGNKLLSFSVKKLIHESSKPKSSSRQFGQSFKKWLKNTMNYQFLKEDDFKINKGTVFLEGSDKELKRFAIDSLGIKNLKRRPDFILRIKDKFIIGEAKFLTDTGGTQNNQFDGALLITKIKKENIRGVAVIDGVVWLKSNSYMHKTIKKLKATTLSALLLKDFIKEQEKSNNKSL